MKKIAVINGLRGYAILSVVLWHLFGKEIPPLFLISLPVKAGVGVKLLFILSGFVLSLPYLSGRRPLEGPRDIFDFYRRRAARLLPLYFISVAVAMILRGPIDGREFWREALFMGTITFIYSRAYFFPPVNRVLWTLGLEAWFGVLLPFLLLLSRKIGVLRFFALALLASMIAKDLGFYFDAYVWDAAYFFPLKNSLLGNGILGRLDDFALGIFLAHIYLRTKGLSQNTARLLFLGGLLLLLTGCWLQDAALLNRIARPWAANSRLIISAGLSMLLMALLFLDRGPLKILFTNTPIQLIGMTCYSIFAWHTLLLKQFLVHGPLDPLRLLLYAVTLLAVTAFSYRFIEFAREKDVRRIFRTVDA